MVWCMLSVGGQMTATEIDVGACTLGQMHMPRWVEFIMNTLLFTDFAHKIYTQFCGDVLQQQSKHAHRVNGDQQQIVDQHAERTTTP